MTTHSPVSHGSRRPWLVSGSRQDGHCPRAWIEMGEEWGPGLGGGEIKLGLGTLRGQGP